MTVSGCGTGFISDGLLEKELKVIAVKQPSAMLDEPRSVRSSLEYRQGEQGVSILKARLFR